MMWLGVHREQSRAAEPKLLWLFDSGDFRSRLNKCCPSLGNLPSEELMERLSKQLEVVEVCSGFPAMHDPAQIGDSAGMSISFGLTGSFFLNDWEAVLLHSANPHSVWHKIEATYVAFSVESTLQEVLVKKWVGWVFGYTVAGTALFTEQVLWYSRPELRNALHHNKWDGVSFHLGQRSTRWVHLTWNQLLGRG